MGQINRITRSLICLPIILYQYLLSPIIGSCCRFHPSCSQYAIEAIKHFGFFKGTRLAVYRLLRCHPWSKGGYDPILSNKEKL